MKNLVKNIKQGVTIALSFTATLGLIGASYATWVSLTDVIPGESLTADVFNKVLENQRDLKATVDGFSSVGRNYCNVSTYSGHDTTSASWANLSGLGSCNLVTTGGKIKLTMDFSVYGIHHGGIRLIDNTTGTIYGTNSSYGLDWVFPSPDNAWYKRSMTRVFNVPAGVHDFGIQIRSQAGGSRFYISTGNESEEYSGFHLYIEEL